MTIQRVLGLYIAPLLLWWLIGVWLYRWVKDSALIMTNIAGQPTASTQVGDLVVTTNSTDNLLTITANKNFPDTLSAMTFLIHFDPETVKITSADIASSFIFSVFDTEPWQLMLTLPNLMTQPLSPSDILFTIRPTGSALDIVVSDGTAFFGNEGESRLSLSALTTP